jgi:hypothetical protein
LWELGRCLARTAGIGAWEQLSPHCLRHSAITFAMDAGASLRDVQDYASRKDPRTTRRYDHSRDSLDRNPPIPSPPTWRSSIAELPGSAPSRQASPAAGIPATSAGTSRMSP